MVLMLLRAAAVPLASHPVHKGTGSTGQQRMGQAACDRDKSTSTSSWHWLNWCLKSPGEISALCLIHQPGFTMTPEHPRERAGMTHKVVVLVLSEKPVRTGIVPSAPLAGAGTPRPPGPPPGQAGLCVSPGTGTGHTQSWKSRFGCVLLLLGPQRLRDSQDPPARGPSPRKGRGGCRAARGDPPTPTRVSPAAMDGPRAGQDAMRNCTDQEFWDTLVSQCIPCSLACRQSLARKCDAVCGECWAAPAWEGQGWAKLGGRGRAWDGPQGRLRASSALQSFRPNAQGDVTAPQDGLGLETAQEQGLQLCSLLGSPGCTLTPVPTGEFPVPPSKGRDVDNDKPQPGTGPEAS